MKRMVSSRFVLSCLVTGTIILSGCSQSSPAGENPVSQTESTQKVSSEEFLNAVRTGVQKRWDFADSTDDHSPKAYIQAVSDVLDSVRDFADKDFEDAGLKKKADQLIKDLQDSLSAAQMMENDLANGSLKYIPANSAYEDDLIDLYENNGLRFDEKYTEDFQDYLDASKADNEDGVKEILQLLYTLSVTEKDGEYGNKQYYLNGENPTDKTFNSFMIQLDLADSSDTSLGTATTDQISSLDPGQKFSVPVYYDETAGDLSSLFLTPQFEPLAQQAFENSGQQNQ